MRSTATDLLSGLDPELHGLVSALAEQRVATDLCARTLSQPVAKGDREIWYRRPLYDAVRVMREQTVQDKAQGAAHVLTAQISELTDDKHHHIALDEAAQIVVEGAAIQLATTFDVDQFKIKASTRSEAVDRWRRSVAQEQVKHGVNGALCASGESPEFGLDFLAYARSRIFVDSVVIDLQERFPDNPTAGHGSAAWYEPARRATAERLAQRADGEQRATDLAVRATQQLRGFPRLDPAGDNELAAKLIAETASFKFAPMLAYEQPATSKVLDAVVSEWAQSMQDSLATSVRPAAADLFVVDSSLGHSL